MEGRLKPGWKDGLGGSGLGCVGWGGRRWEAYFGRTDRKKMGVRHEWARSRADLELVGLS